MGLIGAAGVGISKLAGMAFKWADLL
jgi:hypothetical protein